jgi:hypothetical protein
MIAKRRTRRAKRPPKVAYTLITRADHPAEYGRLDRLVALFHPDLADAAIGIAWCTSWRADLDRKLTLARMRRASDLDRELHAWDLVILLNREFWEATETTPEQRDALLDHELEHATTRNDPDTGDPMRNERGRVIYRLRRHDIEEFAAVVDRHGLWRHDLEQFARAIANSKAHPRLPLDPGPEGPEDPPIRESREVH